MESSPSRMLPNDHFLLRINDWSGPSDMASVKSRSEYRTESTLVESEGGLLLGSFDGSIGDSIDAAEQDTTVDPRDDDASSSSLDDDTNNVERATVELGPPLTEIDVTPHSLAAEDMTEAPLFEPSDTVHLLVLQHRAIKYGLYLGIFLYVCGRSEYVVVVALLVWVSLELAS